MCEHIEGKHRKSFLPEATALSLQPTHKYTGLNKYFIAKRELFGVSVIDHLMSFWGYEDELRLESSFIWLHKSEIVVKFLSRFTLSFCKAFEKLSLSFQ